MYKNHLAYINSESVLTVLVSGEITHALANKVSTSKENDKYERILVNNDIYNILLERDNYLYIFEEFYRNGLPIRGKYRYISSINQSINIFHKNNFVIVNEFKYVDTLSIINKYVDDDKKYYLNNYYIYDDVTNNYLVPKKEILKNNLFINPKNYDSVSVFVIDRNYINKYFNITENKPINIFDLFELSNKNDDFQELTTEN
jgi:hypothetical protein